MSKRVIASIGVVVVSIAADVTAVLASQGNSSPGTGTIVVQSFTFRSHGNPTTSEMAITETSASGRVQRTLQTASFAPGIESEEGPESISAYVTRDHTIYAMTESSIIALQERRDSHRVWLPLRLAGNATGTLGARYFKRLLDTDFYKVTAHTTIRGRPALKLVPERPHRHNVKLEFAGTAYVRPGTYAPIKEMITQPGGPTVTITWKRYEVLHATRANERLLSLTAQHPAARIDHSPAAFLRATAYLRMKHAHS